MIGRERGQLVSEATSVSSVKTVLNHPVLRHFVVLHALSVAGLVVSAAGFAVLVAHLWASGVAFVAVAWLALCAAVAAQVVTPWLPTVAGRAGAGFVLGWAVALMAAVSLCLAVAPGVVTAFTMAPVWGGLWAAREVTGTLPALTRLSGDARRAVQHTNRGVAAAVAGLILVAMVAVSVWVVSGEPDGVMQSLQVVQVAGWAGLAVAGLQAVSVGLWRRAVPLVAQQVVAPEVTFDPWWRTRAWYPVAVVWRGAPRGEVVGWAAASALLATVVTVLPVVLVYRSGPAGVMASALTVVTGMVLGGWVRDAQLFTEASVLRWGTVAMASVAGAGAVVSTGFAGTNLLCGALGMLLGFALAAGPTLAGNRFARAAMQRSFEVFSVALPAVAAVIAFGVASPPVYAASAMFAVIAVVALFLMTAPLWLPKARRRRRERAAAGGVAELRELDGPDTSGGDAESADGPGEVVAVDDAAAPADTVGQVEAAVGGDTVVGAPDAGILAGLALAQPAEGEVPECGRGRFIAVEGGDGAGKSTIVSALATALGERTEQRIVVTREPGGTAAGRRLRDLLLGNVSWVGRAEALMFAADRAQHVAAVIRPALAEESVVISDRFMDSSIAYQSGGRELSAAEVETLSRWATDDLVPHVTVLLDLDPEAARERRQSDVGRGGPDRMEAECEEFHARVRAAFLARAEAHPERYVVVDAANPRPVVVREVVKRVLHHLGWDTDAFAATGEVPVVGGPQGAARGGAGVPVAVPSVSGSAGEPGAARRDSELLPTAREVAEAAANVGRPGGGAAAKPGGVLGARGGAVGGETGLGSAGPGSAGVVASGPDTGVAGPSGSGRSGSDQGGTSGGRMFDVLRGALPGRGRRQDTQQPRSGVSPAPVPGGVVDAVEPDARQTLRPDADNARTWGAMVPSVVSSASVDPQSAPTNPASAEVTPGVGRADEAELARSGAATAEPGAEDPSAGAAVDAADQAAQRSAELWADAALHADDVVPGEAETEALAEADHSVGSQPLTDDEVAFQIPDEPTTEAARFARGLIDREEALDPVSAAEPGVLARPTARQPERPTPAPGHQAMDGQAVDTHPGDVRSDDASLGDADRSSGHQGVYPSAREASDVAGGPDGESLTEMDTGPESEWAEPAPPVRVADVAPTTGQLAAVVDATPRSERIPSPVASHQHQAGPVTEPQREPDETFPLMDRTPPGHHADPGATANVPAGQAWGAPSTHSAHRAHMAESAQHAAAEAERRASTGAAQQTPPAVSGPAGGAPGANVLAASAGDELGDTAAGQPATNVPAVGAPDEHATESPTRQAPGAHAAPIPVTPGTETYHHGESEVGQPPLPVTEPAPMPVDRPDPAQRVDTGRLGHLAPPPDVLRAAPQAENVPQTDAIPQGGEPAVTQPAGHTSVAPSSEHSAVLDQVADPGPTTEPTGHQPAASGPADASGRSESEFPLMPRGVGESQTADPAQLPPRREVHRAGASRRVVDVRDGVTPESAVVADPTQADPDTAEAATGTVASEQPAPATGETANDPAARQQAAASAEAEQDYEDWFYEGEYGDEYRPR